MHASPQGNCPVPVRRLGEEGEKAGRSLSLTPKKRAGKGRVSRFRTE
jgi:hypothetical protein